MRKSKDIEITRKGDDKGKKFRIYRMTAWDADLWAQDMVQLVNRSIPGALYDVARAGFTNLSFTDENGKTAGGVELLCGPLFANMDREARNRLFGELFDNMRRISPNGEERKIDWDKGDAEDAHTIPTLRLEAFKLHMDFLEAEAESTSPMGANLEKVLKASQK